MAIQAENAIARRCGAQAAMLTNSGTSALWASLKLLRTSARQAVILPAFGYTAAANVAMSLGFDLYVADSHSKTPVVDPASVERLLDERVAAVIGINYFGHSVDWDAIPKGSYGTIEDAAGSFGATYKGRPSGSNGGCGIFSFHTTKAASAGGEGGCLVGDADFVQRAKLVAKNGLDPAQYYFSLTTGLNMLMSDLGACFLIDAMQQSRSLMQCRRRVAAQISELLSDIGIRPLPFNADDKVRIQNHQVFSMLVSNRDYVIEVLRLNGLEVRPCWPHLLVDQPVFHPNIVKQDGELNNARIFADQIVNLPVDPTLDDRLTDRLRKALRSVSHCLISHLDV